MSEPKDLPTLTREELLAWVVARQRQIAELRTSHEAVRAELDQLTRGGRRQAAPFSRGIRVTDPKPPGRKPGCGTFRYRDAPPPETVTEPPVEVLVTRAGCPTCGGPLAEERVDFG
jgi:transposase